MPKDWKIGMLLGLVLTTFAILWFSTRSNSNVNEQLNNSITKQNKSPGQLPPFLTALEPSAGNSDSLPNEPNKIDYNQFEQSSKIQTQRFYIVQKGDTLSIIAEKFYGSPSKWHKIRDANKIENVNSLTPGTKLIIPR